MPHIHHFRRTSALERQRSGARDDTAAERLIRRVAGLSQRQADLDIFARNPDLYHAIAEAIPQIVWTAEADGTVDYMNRRWFEYTGLTEEETYKETKSAVHPDDLPIYQRKWKESIEKQIPYEMEYRFRRASDGEYRWHLGRGLPVRDQAGTVIKWFGTCTEIHAQKEAEAEVRALNEALEEKVQQRTRLLQNMLGTMPMAAVAADKKFRVQHCNQQFCELFAITQSPSVMIGADCIAILRRATPYFQSASDYASMLDMLLPSTFLPFRRELTMRDGRVLFLEYIPIGDGGAKDGHLLIFRDITQEKRIDKAKSEFMSLASHQLRTPLTAMRWALGRLKKNLVGKIEAREEDLLGRAHHSALMLADTIRTMLAISRIEAGLMTITLSDVLLHEFLTQIKEEFQQACDAKNILMSVECPVDLSLQIDKNILWEIIKNLASNAIKYTPAGGRVFLRGERRDGLCVLSVADTGYGIPVHEQKKVFTKFFRGENIMHVDTEGTGLGLYMISQMIGLIGGTIEFTSSENEGTTFLLKFRAS